MRFFNVKINIPDDAQYITIDADGEICAWTKRPERDDVCWYSTKVGPILGYSDHTEQWNTHWYVKSKDGDWHHETATQYAEGRKDDAAKLRYDLLPPKAVEQLTAVLTYGAEKYGASATGNWQHVSFAEDRYYAAALRHIQAWRQGEQLDLESGLPHLAHAMCSLAFLLEQSDDSTRS